jgi:hypothetical protein
MRLNLFTMTLLTMSALTAPALVLPSAAWGSPDCGDATVKTADATYTIKTPEQFVAAEKVQVAPVLEKLPQPNSSNSVPVFLQVAQVTQVAEPRTMEPPVSDLKLAAPVQAYADILQRRISRGEGGLNLFDYAGADAAGEIVDITAYTDHLAAQNPDAMVESDQIAYWANLYNALTVKVILENYPVKSIRKIKSGALSIGPWKRDAVTVNGKVLTLNEIEHEILRKNYANPALVHYMVNCASIGCPNLGGKPWNGATLDADRDQAARDFINSPRGVAINGNKLKASSIYNWFKVDFGGSKSATLDHFRKYAGPELKAALDAGAKIDGYGYDWSLNE